MDLYEQKQMRQYAKNYVSMDKIGFLKYVPNRNNKILTQEYLLSLDSKQTHINNHTFIVSDDHEDLANSFIIPNVLQGNTNYLIMDPDALVYDKTQAFLRKEDYVICILNLTDNSYPNQIDIDTFNFAQILSQKAALFIVLPAADNSHDKSISAFLTKFIKYVQEAASKLPNGCLSRPLQLFLNLNHEIEISELAQKMITCRRRGLCYNVFCGHYHHFRTEYHVEWEVIIDCCDTIMYFGCEDLEFRKYFKGFMTHILSSESVILLPKDACILLVRGMYQICSMKYQSKNHPNYPKN